MKLSFAFSAVRFRHSVFVVATACLAGVGCARNQDRGPIVSGIETSTVGVAPASTKVLEALKEQAAAASVNPQAMMDLTTPSDAPEISAKVTFQKKAILNRIFLYGSDIQYSSLHDDTFDILQQSEAVGHVPCYFRIVDSHLQLIADQRSQFESDVNHPERLIEDLHILSQDADSVTVEFTKASPVLNTAISTKAPAMRTSWVRSVQYVPDGQYLMFETSAELTDGTVGEFMETFFPRDSLVGKDDKPLYNDEELEPLAKRFRFLDSGDIWLDVPNHGRVKTKVATRFVLKPGQTIDWYVTPNVPPEYLPQLKAGIEGWNRYSQAMSGKDMIAFKGVLPAGVKLGDPRYNIVNWDSVSKAGAAYETQAADPFTGVQSHALIYLPKAWINIGTDYWKAGAPSDSVHAKVDRLRETIAHESFLEQKMRVQCLRDAADNISLEARWTPDNFAKELLKGVLFHEVGHALGLAHNFKGSLSYDPKDSKTMFSTSIMDYNQYQLEKAAFESLESSKGPLLEYDRQIISELYNSGKDVKSSDPVEPACADDEADNEDGGVDPLCVRYDAGHDPTLQLESTIALGKDPAATLGPLQSLPAAINSLAGEFGDNGSVKSEDDAKAKIDDMTKALTGVVGFYYTEGAQSLSYAVRGDVKALKIYEKSILPDDYKELPMRLREADGITYVATLEDFEPATKKAIQNLGSALRSWLATTPYLARSSSGGTNDQEKQLDGLMKGFDALPADLADRVLTKLRTKVLGTLKASDKAPFFFVQDKSGLTADFESEMAQVLNRAVTLPLSDGTPRPVDERLAAAAAFKTYADTAMGAPLLAQAEQTLLNEARAAKDVEERTSAMAVYRALKASDAGASSLATR